MDLRRQLIEIKEYRACGAVEIIRGSNIRAGLNRHSNNNEQMFSGTEPTLSKRLQRAHGRAQKCLYRLFPEKQSCLIGTTKHESPCLRPSHRTSSRRRVHRARNSPDLRTCPSLW